MDSRFVPLNRELMSTPPLISCAFTWRSLRWNIAPDNYSLALQLIEAHCTDELTDWHPSIVLSDDAPPVEPWRRIAQAILTSSQLQLEQSIEEAKSCYSPIGFSIVSRGYKALLSSESISTDIIWVDR
jgi:hypothetical protein